MAIIDPYDEVPYSCRPIEWTAPERLTLTSLLHGGPRLPRGDYWVLELGCGNGANLLPQAYYREHATFVGVDGASSQIEIAKARKSELGLSNVEFIHADFTSADDRLSGQFDYIVGHGIFSWVSDQVRDSLLRLCARRLRPGGLLYLNYNANPGWSVRGMVREFLIAQTAGIAAGLRARAKAAQEVASRMAASLPNGDQAYSRLLAGEFTFVCENDLSYIAHEYLAEHNRAYWRSEFMALVRSHGLEFVADADFNYASGRIPDDLVPRLSEQQIRGRGVDDTVDLLCYRQLHSPILTSSPFVRRPPDLDEFANLTIASCLTANGSNAQGHSMHLHPSGYQVEAKEELLSIAFARLRAVWPRGMRVGAIFPDVTHVKDDLMLLHRNGLLELRCVEPAELGVPRDLLNLENRYGGYVTNPYHSREDAGTHLDSVLSVSVGEV
jgi:SAM-dependent methyltransferase